MKRAPNRSLGPVHGIRNDWINMNQHLVSSFMGPIKISLADKSRGNFMVSRGCWDPGTHPETARRASGRASTCHDTWLRHAAPGGYEEFLTLKTASWMSCFFPTCQVRVVRFYQSCSSPPPSPPRSPPPPLPPLPCPLPPCQLFAKLFANFCTQWPLLDLNCKGLSALGTAGPQPGTFRAQWAPLDLHLGPSELSEHGWTSTWDPPSAVSTAGPQPGTLRAQWAPLGLNLGPSDLSEHRWTSTAR